jgi:tetratricopeptide (TPR) repeat protein
MKPTFRVLGVWVFVFLAGMALAPRGTAETEAAETPPSEAMQAVYAEALQLMNQGKIDDALAKLASGPAAEGDHSAVLNLKGALHVRKKDYPTAAAAFGKILEKSPNNAVARFNLGEVHFLQKNYPKAKEFFGQFLKEPGNSQNALARYKIFLCDLLGADPAAATQTLKGLEPTISHPFYYYANAASAFKAGRESAAREYIQSAFGIYPGGLNAAFADSLVELGWLKQEEIAQIGAIDSAALQSLSSEFRPEAAAPGAGAPAAPDALGFENVLPDFAREKPPAPSVQP